MRKEGKGRRGALSAALTAACVAAFLGGLYLLPDLWERHAIRKLRSDESAWE